MSCPTRLSHCPDCVLLYLSIASGRACACWWRARGWRDRRFLTGCRLLWHRLKIVALRWSVHHKLFRSSDGKHNANRMSCNEVFAFSPAPSSPFYGHVCCRCHRTTRLAPCAIWFVTSRHCVGAGGVSALLASALSAGCGRARCGERGILPCA